MTQAATDNDTMVAVTPEIAACPFGHPFVAKYPRSAVQRVVWARGFADRYKVMCECGAEGPYGDTQKEALDAWNALHQSGRTGAGERETVARVIHQCLRPVNMVNADWDSGAILGANNSWRRSVYSTADHILAALSQSTAGEDGA